MNFSPYSTVSMNTMMCATISPELPPKPQDLFVDFPHRSRICWESKGVFVSTNQLCIRHCVHFSEFSQVVFIPYDDPKSKWYTDEEEHILRQESITDTCMVRSLLQEVPAWMGKDIVDECLSLRIQPLPVIAHKIIQ